MKSRSEENKQNSSENQSNPRDILSNVVSGVKDGLKIIKNAIKVPPIVDIGLATADILTHEPDSAQTKKDIICGKVNRITTNTIKDAIVRGAGVVYAVALPTPDPFSRAAAAIIGGLSVTPMAKEMSKASGKTVENVCISTLDWLGFDESKSVKLQQKQQARDDLVVTQNPSHYDAIKYEGSYTKVNGVSDYNLAIVQNPQYLTPTGVYPVPTHPKQYTAISIPTTRGLQFLGVVGTGYALAKTSQEITNSEKPGLEAEHQVALFSAAVKEGMAIRLGAAFQPAAPYTVPVCIASGSILSGVTAADLDWHAAGKMAESARTLETNNSGNKSSCKDNSPQNPITTPSPSTNENTKNLSSNSDDRYQVNFEFNRRQHTLEVGLGLEINVGTENNPVVATSCQNGYCVIDMRVGPDVYEQIQVPYQPISDNNRAIVPRATTNPSNVSSTNSMLATMRSSHPDALLNYPTPLEQAYSAAKDQEMIARQKGHIAALTDTINYSSSPMLSRFNEMQHLQSVNNDCKPLADRIQSLQSSQQDFSNSRLSSACSTNLSFFSQESRPTVYLTNSMNRETVHSNARFMHSSFKEQPPPVNTGSFSFLYYANSGGNGSQSNYCDSRFENCQNSGNSMGNCQDSSSSKCESSLKF